MKKNQLPSILKNQHGVSAIVIAICIFMLVGFVALSVDVFHFIVVKNELQNAADAGALAGAAALYKDTLGASVDPLANLQAVGGATANKSEKVAVELYNYDGTVNNQCLDPVIVTISDETYEDVQRGHWYFSNPSGTPPVNDPSHFECNSTTTAVNVANYTTDQLNADSNFINAVQVVTRRTRRAMGTPIISFFANIFGYKDFQMYAKAVGYIGFASLNVQIGAPIVICRESIKNWDTGGPIACNEGRMYNANNDTARWSSLEDCDGNTNAADLTTLIAQTCGPDSVDPYVTTPELSTMEGQVNSAFDDEINCWLNGYNKIVKPDVDINPIDEEDDTESVSLDHMGDDSIPDQPWKLTLPVIICEGDEAAGPTCGPVDGFVEVKIVWMAMKDDIESTDTDAPGAPNYMYYDIPHYDPTDIERDTTNDMVYGDAWPNDWPPGYAGVDGYGYYKTHGTVTIPREEPIYDPNINMGDESFIYDILKENLSTQELDKLTKDIGNFNSDWKDPDGWSEDYPYWTTVTTLGDFLNDFGEVRWASLVKHFKLRNKAGDPAVYVKKTFYFMPTCNKVESSGNTGFQNWGILSKYPVLVK